MAKLSDFELDIMSCFWERKRLSAPDVHRLLGVQRGVTYSTIRDTEQGREEGEGTWTLSGDGNHYRTLTVWKDREGKARPANERRFTRNSENCLNHAQDGLFRECQRRSRPPRN